MNALIDARVALIWARPLLTTDKRRPFPTEKQVVPDDIASRRFHNNVEKGSTGPFAGAQAAQPVQGALQDVSRGHLVDDLRPPGARHVIVDKRPGDDGGREPLVPKHDGQSRSASRGCARKPASIGRAGLSRPSRSSGSPRTIPATSNSAKIAVSASASLSNAPRGRVFEAARRGGARRRRSQGRWSSSRGRCRSGAPWAEGAEGEIFDCERATHRT